MGQLDVLLQKKGLNSKNTTLKSTGGGNLDSLLSTNKGRITVSQPKKATVTKKVVTTPPKTDLVSQTKAKTNNIIAQSKTLINQNKPKAKIVLNEAKKVAIDTAKDVGYALVSPLKEAPVQFNKDYRKELKTIKTSKEYKKAEVEAKNARKKKDYQKEAELRQKMQKMTDITGKYGGLTPEQSARAREGSSFAFTFTKAGGLMPEAGAVTGNVGFIIRQSKNKVTNKILRKLPEGEVEVNKVVQAVIDTGTQNTKEGKAIIKGSLEAKNQGKKVEIVSAKELGFVEADVKKQAVKSADQNVTTVSIEKIDSGLSPLMKDKKLNVDDMVKTLKDGKELPPIPVYKEGEKLILNSDGNRRYQAYLQAGVKDVPVKIEAKTTLSPLAKNNSERAIVKAEKPKEVVSEKIVKTETTKKPSYTSKEARTIQESFSNDIQRISHGSGSEDELIGKINKLYDETIPKVQGDRSALAGLRTSLNKEMFEFAGIKGGSYKANYAELKTLMDSPDIGKYLSNLEKKVAEIDDLILKTPEKTKVITKKSEKVITTREIPKPIGKGETKQAGLAVGVEAKAIEKKLVDNLGDLPEFKQVNMRDQANLAGKLLAKNEDDAIKIALGQKAPPSNILPESVFIAVENKAIREGNVDLLRQLASSSRTTEATAMGQRIRTLRERMDDSPTKLMADIINERKKAFETKFKGRSEAEVMKKEVNRIKTRVKQPDKNDWGSFIKSIQC